MNHAEVDARGRAGVQQERLMMDWGDAANTSRRGVATRPDVAEGGVYYRWLDGVSYFYPNNDPQRRRRCFPREVEGHADWEPVLA